MVRKWKWYSLTIYRYVGLGFSPRLLDLEAEARACWHRQPADPETAPAKSHSSRKVLHDVFL